MLPLFPNDALSHPESKRAEMATTSIQSLVADLFDAIEAQQFDRAIDYLASDFQFSGPVPVPLNSLQWIRMHRALATAMPDITVNYIPNDHSYGVVHGSVQLSGTHTTKLDLRIPGVPAVFATGKRITLPREKVDVAVECGKVTVLKVENLPDGGLMGILAQMGVALPHA
jgi:hypothetical protein